MAISLLGLTLRVPDHTALPSFGDRGSPAIAVDAANGYARCGHLSVDSTGLKLCGAGEWLVEKHGTKARGRGKLHLGVDADTGQIVASALTSKEIDDGVQVGPLLDQVAGSLSSFTADGAYDQDGVYAAVADRDPETEVIVPPRITAVSAARLTPHRPSAIATCGVLLRRAAWPGRRPIDIISVPKWKQLSGDGNK